MMILIGLKYKRIGKTLDCLKIALRDVSSLNEIPKMLPLGQKIILFMHGEFPLL